MANGGQANDAEANDGKLKADIEGRAFRAAYAPNTVTRADPRPAPRTTPLHHGRLVAPCQTPQGRWRRQIIVAHYSLNPQPRMHGAGALRRRTPTRMHKYPSNPWSTSPITAVPFNQPGDADACRSACRETTRILSFCWEVKNHAEAKMYSANRCLHGITPVEMRKHVGCNSIAGFFPQVTIGKREWDINIAITIHLRNIHSSCNPRFTGRTTKPYHKVERNIHSLPSQPAHNPHHPKFPYWTQLADKGIHEGLQNAAGHDPFNPVNITDGFRRPRRDHR